MESIEEFIDELPKAEVHLHLVGSASVPTVLELAQRHPEGGVVPRTEPELRAFFEFRDFPHFAEIYGAVSALVREPADITALVTGAARDLAGQNVRYAELTVTPHTFTKEGMPAAEVTEALDTAAAAARQEHGVRIGYIFDIAGEYGRDAARPTLDHALSWPPEALTGFGLAGIEQARPAYRDDFREVFAAAVAAGLHSVPHAGEMSGPETIWEALNGPAAPAAGRGPVRDAEQRRPADVRHVADPGVPAGGLGARAEPRPAGRPGAQWSAGLVPGRRGQASPARRDRRRGRPGGGRGRGRFRYARLTVRDSCLGWALLLAARTTPVLTGG